MAIYPPKRFITKEDKWKHLQGFKLQDCMTATPTWFRSSGARLLVATSTVPVLSNLLTIPDRATTANTSTVCGRKQRDGKFKWVAKPALSLSNTYVAQTKDLKSVTGTWDSNLLWTLSIFWSNMKCP